MYVYATPIPLIPINVLALHIHAVQIYTLPYIIYDKLFGLPTRRKHLIRRDHK